MNKKQCIEYGQHEGVIREKNILANIDHPFLLKMWGSYQTEKHLMMLIDLIQGGELFTVLHTDKRDGVSNADATFYAACVLEGLGHLHERNIVYRDLKPENGKFLAWCIRYSAVRETRSTDMPLSCSFN
jgi:protein kinase A